MKKILLIVAFLFILIAIPLTVYLARQQQDIRQKAVAATTLYIQPASVTKNVNDTFSLDIMAETGVNTVAAVELHLNFSALHLEAISIQKGDFLEDVLVAGTVENGGASITLGSGTQGYKQGTGKVATITFKALSETSAPTGITFSSATQVSAGDDPGKNVLASTQGAEVTIGQGTGASPAPSASAVASGAPSPSPSTVASPVATPRPSPSASGTSTASPSPSATSSTQVTRITSPTSGSTTTNKRPPITGVSFANAFIILSINTTPQVASNFYADASGNWSYTPTADISNGTYTITVTGENTTTGVLENTTATFTVAATGTGGTTTASPSPSATASPGSSPVASATTSPASSATSSDVPVTGTATPTIFLMGLALLMLAFGTVIFLK